MFFYVVCGFIVCIVETDRGMFKVHIYKTESPLLVQSWLVGIALTRPLKQQETLGGAMYWLYIFICYLTWLKLQTTKRKYLTKPVIASALPFWLSPFPFTRPEPNIGTRTFLCQHLLLYSAFHTRKMDLLSNRWVVSLLVCVFFAGKFYCHYVQFTRPHFCSWAKCVCVSGA